jgi:hypothetical protein
MRSVPDNFQKFSNIATMLTFVVALAALLVAVKQIQSANLSQREATAQETYGEYLKLAIEKPELADGIVDQNATAEDRAKYSWFVSYCLHAAEHIYLLFPDDENWANALRSQICPHRDYLSGEEFQKSLKSHYDPAFQRFMDRALAGCPPAAPR